MATPEALAKLATAGLCGWFCARGSFRDPFEDEPCFNGKSDEEDPGDGFKGVLKPTWLLGV